MPKPERAESRGGRRPAESDPLPSGGWCWGCHHSPRSRQPLRLLNPDAQPEEDPGATRLCLPPGSARCPLLRRELGMCGVAESGSATRCLLPWEYDTAQRIKAGLWSQTACAGSLALPPPCWMTSAQARKPSQLQFIHKIGRLTASTSSAFCEGQIRKCT